MHVIGAGAMGGDIAAWCAWHGFTVTLADMKAEPLGKAVARAAELFGKIGHKRTDIRDALDRLIPDLEGEGVRSADLVIEAVPETLELKRKVYAAIEPKMRPGAILATNTSSIPLEELRTGLQRPDQLVGLHFFNPVSRMQLVEVVSHDQVSADVLAKARAFLGRIDRLPAPVKSAPGFLVNRALTPYMLEAMVMLDEGVKRETIDAAAERSACRWVRSSSPTPLGSISACTWPRRSKQASTARCPTRRSCCATRSQLGELGRKTGKGFYTWKNGEAVKERDAPSRPIEMIDRLILPMLDVCVACLREGVVADEDTVDGAMIFATGFAPFRGGPMHYARARGVAKIRQELERLAQRYGDRFRPDPGWDRSEHDAQRRRLRSNSRTQIIWPKRSSSASASSIVLALPLGLGKANHVANALFARAAADPSIHLRIFTALTLEKPRAEVGSRASLHGAARRSALFGGYPDLAYAVAQHAGPAAAQCRGRRVLLPGRHPARRRRRATQLHLAPTTPMRCAT